MFQAQPMQGMMLLLAPMASMMMMVAPRPEVQVNVRSIVVAVVPRTMQVAAMPVAPVAHLGYVGVLAGYLMQACRCATYRCRLGRCEESHYEDGCS